MGRGFGRGPSAIRERIVLLRPWHLGHGLLLAAACSRRPAAAQDIARGQEKGRTRPVPSATARTASPRFRKRPISRATMPSIIAKQLNAFKSGERKHEQMSIIAEEPQRRRYRQPCRLVRRDEGVP